MGRWEPNARGRLMEAALELYRERGFDQTTVADIAERAGLTERTFFRYFTDKREVLFFGSEAMKAVMVAAIATAPAKEPPLETVIAAVEAAGAMIEEVRGVAGARQRYEVISAHPELMEREISKLASLSSAVAGALERRSVKQPTASVVADAGLACFRIGFERWLADPTGKSITKHIRDAVKALRAATR
jgi:AcrR family transcriptional regulator